MPTIVLGVSASIAAYKAADLASQLVKDGFDVWPVLTPGTTRLISPDTFRALTGHPCSIDVFDEPVPGEIAHIYLARHADLVAIVPASMDVIAKLAHGFAPDMLTAIVSATAAPVLLAPGMNTNMWNHPATQANIKILASYGYTFVDPISGNLACRTVGVGKMADVPVVHQAIRDLLGLSGEYSGINLLVTAGPTRELIDPVRFISNRSSGKMGYAIAEAAARRGANVTLVSGPTAIPVPSGVNVVAVETAAQMKDAAEAAFADAHMAILTAAVADFRPVHVSNDKAPKSADFDLTLVATPDIAAELGRNKGSRVLVGFAAETSNVREKALAKKEKKNLDWIVANDVSQPGAGFDVDTNIVTVFGPDNQQTELGLATKREIASNLLSLLRPTLHIPPRSRPS